MHKHADCRESKERWLKKETLMITEKSTAYSRSKAKGRLDKAGHHQVQGQHLTSHDLVGHVLATTKRKLCNKGKKLFKGRKRSTSPFPLTILHIPTTDNNTNIKYMHTTLTYTQSKSRNLIKEKRKAACQYLNQLPQPHRAHVCTCVYVCEPCTSPVRCPVLSACARTQTGSD